MDHLLGDVPTDEESKGHRADAPAPVVLAVVCAWQVAPDAAAGHCRRPALDTALPAASPCKPHVPTAFAVKRTIRVR
jgi:hypothetical protein